MLPDFRCTIAAVLATLVVLIGLVGFVPPRLPTPSMVAGSDALSGRHDAPQGRPSPRHNGELLRLLSLRIGPVSAEASAPADAAGVMSFAPQPPSAQPGAEPARRTVLASLAPFPLSPAPRRGSPIALVPSPARPALIQIANAAPIPIAMPLANAFAPAFPARFADEGREIVIALRPRMLASLPAEAVEARSGQLEIVARELPDGERGAAEEAEPMQADSLPVTGIPWPPVRNAAVKHVRPPLPKIATRLARPRPARALPRAQAKPARRAARKARAASRKARSAARRRSIAKKPAIARRSAKPARAASAAAQQRDPFEAIFGPR
jgi:hypothetical protein